MSLKDIGPAIKYAAAAAIITGVAGLLMEKASSGISPEIVIPVLAGFSVASTAVCAAARLKGKDRGQKMLNRVLGTARGGTIIGTFFPDNPIITAIGAAIGWGAGGLTYKKLGLD